MAETQSRYSIMEELNNRKINEKEKLSNIERETDKTLYNHERTQSQHKAELAAVESSYKQNHKDWKREKTLKLQLAQSDHERYVDVLKNEIKEHDDTYETEFQKYKKTKLETIKNNEEIMQRYKKEQEAKITEKREVILEIEKGIDSLKEMSKEQKSD